MRRPTYSNCGGVLIIVLVLMLVAGAITAGWVSVMSSQLGYVAQYSEGVQRRIATGNTTALVRQYMLIHVLTKNGAPAAAADIGGGWGAVTIPASTTTPLTSFTSSDGYNHFNPGNGDGYTQDFTIPMSMGVAPNAVTISRLFQVRSRSSVLSGTLAMIHRPSNSVTGSVSIAGQTLLWEPTGTYSMASSSFATPSAVQAGGTGIFPNNFPFVPMTGSEISDLPAFDGQLNVIANESDINSLAIMATTSAPNGTQTVNGSTESTSAGITSDGVGNVIINLQNSDVGNVFVAGGVTHLTLTGQSSAANFIAAGNEAAIIILVNQTTPATDLVDVRFTNSNNRKIVLAIKTASEHGTTFIFPQGDPWRVVFTLERTPVTFQLAGAQSFQGGIQSDRSISVLGGSMSFTPEADPKLLERHTARDGWIEAYTLP